MNQALPARAIRFGLGAFTGLLAAALLFTVVSWLVSSCVRDLRKSASDPTSPRAVR